MEIHSSKISAQLVVAGLQKAGIENIVISPGSRNAPLIIEFTNQAFFNTYSVVDERVAGFFALGMAQQKHQPVVLVCTSGSALLNYYPAIAEAFYSQIPLIVVSADRPQKWIDQGEGQSIRQHRVFANHSWFNTTLPEKEDEQAVASLQNKIRQAIETSIEKQGPVHINVPFDEPLYEIVERNKIDFPKVQTEFSVRTYEEKFLENFASKWKDASKIMILAGQHQPSEFLQKQLEKLSENKSVIVLNENIANVHSDKFINNIDQAIFSLNDNELRELQPEILITTGRNLISKKIKKFLRKYKPREHWHVEKTALPPDTFEAMTQHFDTSPEMFFSQFLFLIYDQMKTESGYQDKWLSLKKQKKEKHRKFLSQTGFSDLKVFELLSQQIPGDYMLQWGNSTTVRYAQLFDFQKNNIHFSNRGTSGIDGSTSTASGAAYASERPVLAVTGDISFLYDSNALWNKHIPKNFKIIVINNGGGDIFNFIPGPAQTQALEDFFVTRHRLKAQKLAEMYGFGYQKIDNLEDLESFLPVFFSTNDRAHILEIDTRKINNAEILKKYFENLKD